MKRILIVDDEKATIELLGKLLSEKGYLAEGASDGAEALEKARKNPPDLVLLDVMMPRMDGYGFIRELKKDATLRTRPVVVLTAREMMRDLFVQEGVKDFVTKPFDPQDLLKIVGKYL